MRYLAPVVLAVATALAPAGALAQTSSPAGLPSRALEISFSKGRVTLVARGVTVPEIMGEWARKGGSKVVNAEKIVGGPVTFEFHDVPEAVVLQSVLRSASGFIAAPRRPGGPVGASAIEQILIVAVSRGNAAAVITMPTNPIANPVAIQGSPDDDIPPARPIGPQPPPQQQPMQQAPPQQPTAPVTSPTPGVVIAPVKPGTPVTPGTIIKSPSE